MAQCLGVLDALAEGQGLIPKTHMLVHKHL